jgi:hypothetical protein
MSPAQLLIAAIGVTVAVCTFVLMRYPEHRREQYRGSPFSMPVSIGAAVFILVVFVVFVWAQALSERP